MPKSEAGHHGAVPTPPAQSHVKVTNAEKFGATQKGNFTKVKGSVDRNDANSKVKGGK